MDQPPPPDSPKPRPPFRWVRVTVLTLVIATIWGFNVHDSFKRTRWHIEKSAKVEIERALQHLERATHGVPHERAEAELALQRSWKGTGDELERLRDHWEQIPCNRSPIATHLLSMADSGREAPVAPSGGRPSGERNVYVESWRVHHSYTVPSADGERSHRRDIELEMDVQRHSRHSSRILGVSRITWIKTPEIEVDLTEAPGPLLGPAAERAR